MSLETTTKQFITELRRLHAERERVKSAEKKRAAKRQHLTPKQRQEVLRITDGRCHICR